MPSLSDPVRFQALYLRHHPAVVRAAFGVLHDRVLAEDVAQDVFLELWRRPDRYDAGRGDLGAYLRLLARSRALDAWRSARSGHRAHERLLEHARRERTDGEDAAAQVEDRQRAATLVAAVRALPEAQREAVALSYWGGLAASELADRTRVPLGTAKSRVRLGIARLRGELVRPLGQPTGA